MSTLEYNIRTYCKSRSSLYQSIPGDAQMYCVLHYSPGSIAVQLYTLLQARCWLAWGRFSGNTVQVYCSATKDIHNLALQMTRKIVVFFYICSNCISLAAAVQNVYVPPSTKRFGDLTHFNGPSADKAGRPCVKRFRDDYSLLFKNPLRNLQFWRYSHTLTKVPSCQAACRVFVQENDDTHALQSSLSLYEGRIRINML